MRKILSTFALLFIVLCSGAFAACGNNKTKTGADNFNFTYVKNSAMKTVDGENYNIKINLNVDNVKESENTLDATKFVLKQNDKKVNTASNFMVGTEKKTTIAFKSTEKQDVVLYLVTAKNLTGECILYYGDVQLFKVEI